VKFSDYLDYCKQMSLREQSKGSNNSVQNGAVKSGEDATSETEMVKMLYSLYRLW